MKNVKPKIICRMAHVLNAYELTEQNVGIAIYPAAAAIYADSQKVITKKLIDPSVTASYYLTQRKEKKTLPCCGRVLEICCTKYRRVIHELFYNAYFIYKPLNFIFSSKLIV